MRVLLDVTKLQISTNLLDLVNKLRKIGDDNQSICLEIERICDDESHSLMVESASIEGDDVVLVLDDAEAEAAAGQGWLSRYGI